MASTNISIIPLNGNNTVTEINFGASSPRLGGTVDISAFPNLQQFRCNNHEITALSGYAQNSNLTLVEFSQNNVTGPIPSLSGLNNLQTFRCQRNQLTGPIPSLSGLTNLQFFGCDTNQLTGPIPSLSGLNNLRNFRCDTNQLTGSIPSLSGLNNLQTFRCFTNQLTGFNGGPVSNTLGSFQAQNNQLPSTSVNVILSAFVAANKTAGTRILNLGGVGNAAPAGQGITDKATLVSRGWTVTTN